MARRRTHREVIWGWNPYTEEEIERYVRKGYWPNTTVPDLLARTASRYPHKLAAVDDRGVEVTWGEMKERSDRLARHLLSLGIDYGDFFILQLPNVVEFLYLYFALNRIGAVPVMCLPRHRRLEIEHELRLHEAKGICVAVGEPFDYVGMVEEIKGNHPYLKVFLCAGGEGPGGWVSVDELLRREPEVPAEELENYKPDPNDISTQQLSGGTTGVPKGIPRTHNDYIGQWIADAMAAGYTDESVFLMVIPVAHNAACQIGTGPSLVVGGSIVLTKSPRVEDWYRLIEKYRVTHAMMVPVQISYMIEAGEELRKKYDLSSWKVLAAGGQKVKPELVKWAVEELGVNFMNCFGMAEGPLIFNRWTSPLEAQMYTIGTPIISDPEGWQVKLVDDQGREVPPGEVGEMISKGAHTFKGYFRNPEENAKSFDADGFFHSGDLMSLRPDGRYVVEGRKKDMIIRGGENVYPEPIEDLLVKHPKVVNAACLGMPDPALGERLVAFVQLVKGESFSLEEVREYMREQGVATFQWPERLEVVEGWPLTPFAKIDKRLLRAYITAKLYQEGKIDKALGDEYLRRDKLSIDDVLEGRVRITFEGIPT